jgi:hypothetical protein
MPLPTGIPALSQAASKVFQQLVASPSRWRRLPTGGSKARDFVIGGADCAAGDKITYVIFIDDAEKRLRGLAHFGPSTEGPKGCVHGGASAAMLDVAMGNLCWWSGLKVSPSVVDLQHYGGVGPHFGEPALVDWAQGDE